jgi:hypothetical protein
MSPTITVAGLQIPRAGFVFYIVLAIHVPAGLVAVVTGLVAALSQKGSSRHARSGHIYVRALSVVFATAVVLTAIRVREDYHLLLIGVVAFVAARVGHRLYARHRHGHGPHVLGMSTSYVAMLAAFYVDNGPQLPIWNRLPHVTYWLLPILVGAPLTWNAWRRARAAR